MASDEQGHWIVPTRGAYTFPSIEVLTGRGFITGKSGSGKSNTAGVIAEELLEKGYIIVVVDPEGEYYGLKEAYDVLHIGLDEHCDVHADPDDAASYARTALEQNKPLILDVADYLDPDEPRRLIANTVRELFVQQKEMQKPLLIMIEEMQEYLPQQGGGDELAEILERVAKRGRKRGLGMLGMSQRPSSVDKNFITQCDWMVWHRLTWENDVNLVTSVLGSAYGDQIQELDTGEGFLMTDWEDGVERVSFKRKRTVDAGATPGLDSYEQTSSRPADAPPVDSLAETKSAESIDPTTEASSSGEDPPDGSSATGDTQAGAARADSVASAASGTDAKAALGELRVEQSGRDLTALDAEQLRNRVESLEAENQLLRDEIAELRSILEQTDADGTPQAPNTADDHQRASPSAGTPREPLEKPLPPDPPADRGGIAGNLIEFVQMLAYLSKLLTYRYRAWQYDRHRKLDA